MKYTREDFMRDLKDPNLPHIKDKERFIAFYEELGTLEVQKIQKVRPNRISFIKTIGKSIIELGCHAGFNLVYFAQLGYEVTGVDISSTLIRLALDKKNDLPKEIANRITLIHSDILDLPDIGKFDNVVLTEVLEHVIEPKSILKKSLEYMKPEGRIFISAPSTRIGNFSHVRGISKEWLLEVGTELGLKLKFIPHIEETRAIGTL